MNTFIKTLLLLPFHLISGNAATIIFNGCDSTDNDYFTFTPGDNEYSISKCVPKLNPESATTVTLRIPGSINNGHQVSLGEQAFNLSSLGNEFANLKVNLIFEKVDNTYVEVPTDCSYMFCEQVSLSTEPCALKIAVDLKGLQSSGVREIAGMFYGCINLASIDFTAFDTSNVTTMNSMFWNCQQLESIDVRGFDTRNVTDMMSLF